MDRSEKVEAYFEEDHQFKNAIAVLREEALKTGLNETYKWLFPTYTLNNKNVFAICKFKKHFGIWFFNGVFLKDEKKVLENAQEGKTQAMRHWKFYSENDIDKVTVAAYMTEAIENQKRGIELKPVRQKKIAKIEIPTELKEAFAKNNGAEKAFKKLSPFKQKEFSAYISEAKQPKTKLSRLEKILPMIQQGKGLNDKYR